MTSQSSFYSKGRDGDEVLLRNMRNEARKGGTLERVWTGPYNISKCLEKGLYKLSNTDGVQLKQSYSSARLKQYHRPLNKDMGNYPKKGSDTWVKSLGLNNKDKDILENPNGELKDNHINAAQRLLQKQFPQVLGWQDPLLYQAGGF